MQDIQEVSRQRVWSAYIQLVQLLTSSDLVELPPGASYRHGSSAVLLRGSLRTSGNHCSVISKAAEGICSSAPCTEDPLDKGAIIPVLGVQRPILHCQSSKAAKQMSVGRAL